MYKKDMELYKKNKYVLDSFQKIAENDFSTGTFENDQLFLEGCMANIVLEGIYFYSGFWCFMCFAEIKNAWFCTDDSVYQS